VRPNDSLQWLAATSALGSISPPAGGKSTASGGWAAGDLLGIIRKTTGHPIFSAASITSLSFGFNAATNWKNSFSDIAAQP
jgi:hypothetical protein